MIDIATFRFCLLSLLVPGALAWCLVAYLTARCWFERSYDVAYASGGTMVSPGCSRSTLVHGVLYIVDRPLPVGGVLRDISFIPASTVLQAWLRTLVGSDTLSGWRVKRWVR